MLTNTLPAILIPAYQPSEALIQLVSKLRQLCPNQRIIVVNDGSDSNKNPIFSQLHHFTTEVLHHTENLGKGQALKTGFRYWLTTSLSTEPGVITADADGQHVPQDIYRVQTAFIKHPTALHLGVRYFNKHSTPWRSRLGNRFTRLILRLFTKVPLKDTQTGLRAIPKKLIPTLLDLKTAGYDFELDMLLAAQKKCLSIQQIEIKTVYIDNNAASHFNPFIDSIKIYFVVLRFAAIALLSATIDFGLFFFVFWTTKNILLAVLTGRLLSASFNFTCNKHLTFKSDKRIFSTALKYTGLAFFLGLIACLLIKLLLKFNLSIYVSKIITEVTLFSISFSLQRYFVFNRTSDSG